MNRVERLKFGLLGVYGFFWVCGVGAYAVLGGPPSHVAWTAPLFLLLAGATVLAFAAKGNRARLVVCAFLGYGVEVLGVHTGFPFGGYRYTEALSPLLFEVPIAMTGAWVVLIAYVVAMLGPREWPQWKIVVVGALWMTAIDLVIDPLAAGPLAYWSWEHPGMYYGIPVTNFAGWILASAFILAASRRMRESSATIRNLGLSIVLFFTVLALVMGAMLPLAVGTGLCGVHLVTLRQNRQLTCA